MVDNKAKMPRVIIGLLSRSFPTFKRVFIRDSEPLTDKTTDKTKNTITIDIQ